MYARYCCEYYRAKHDYFAVTLARVIQTSKQSLKINSVQNDARIIEKVFINLISLILFIAPLSLSSSRNDVMQRQSQMGAICRTK